MASTAKRRDSGQDGAELEALGRRFVDDLLNRGNLDAAEELVAKDLVVIGVGADSRAEGRDTITEMAEEWRRAVPDGEVTLDETVVQGDTVVLFCTWRGTVAEARGPLPAAAVGGSFAMEQVYRLRVEDERITEVWRLSNAIGMMRQLGVLPDSPGAVLRLLLGNLRHRLGGR